MLHCNGIDPFVTLMGNFNWGPISRNDIVSNANHDAGFMRDSRSIHANIREAVNLRMECYFLFEIFT